MELRRELLFGVGGIVLLNLVVAFVCVGLFARMGPPIDAILGPGHAAPAVAETAEVAPSAPGGEATPASSGAPARDEASMRVARDEARRLAHAGAWTAVLVGFLSFLLSFIVLLRLQERIVRPVIELREVLDGLRHGDRLRRCRPLLAVRELVQVSQELNGLLDERAMRLGVRPDEPSSAAEKPSVPA